MLRPHVTPLSIWLGLTLFVSGCSGQPTPRRATPPAASATPFAARSERVPALGKVVSATEPERKNLLGRTLTVELVPQLGHGLNINGISISPNGKIAATASADKTVRVWDVDSGITLRQLSIGAQVQDIAILRDGVRAAIVGADDVQLWDLSSAKRYQRFETEKSDAFRIKLFKNKDWAVLADAAGGLELWDLARPVLIRKLAAENPKGRNAIYALDVSKDERLVAAGGDGGALRLIDVDNATVLRTLTGHTDTVRAVAFSKNGETLTSFSADGTIRQWDTRQGRERRQLQFGPPIAAACLVSDTLALVGGYSGPIKQIELPSGNHRRNLEPWPGVPLDGLDAVATTPDGRKSVTADRNNSVLFSNLSDGSPIHATQERRGGPFSLAVSPRGNLAAISFGGGDVDVWDAVLGARLRRLPAFASSNSVSNVAFSPDGRLLFRSAFRTLHILDSRSFELIRTIETPDLTICSLAVSPDSKLVSLGGFGAVSVFEVESGRKLWSREHQVTVDSVAFTPDSRQLLAGSENQNTRLYDARSGHERLRFVGPRSGLSSIDFLTQDTVLFGAFDVLGLWSMSSGQSSRQISTFREGAGVGAFSTDKRWIFGGDDVGTMSLYEISTGKRVRQYEAHTDQIQAIVPSRDGKLVFSTSFDGTIRVIPADLLNREKPERDPRPMVWLGDRNDWLAYSTDGYFDASRRGGTLVAAVSGLDGFRVDQLAVRNNRPDMTLSRLGLGTKEALSVFERRHVQRLKRLGFDESELSENLMTAPRATIVDYTLVGRRARLRCTFSGNGRKLKRYYAFVNDVAVGNGDGVPLNGTNASVELEVDLSAGRNKVEVSVLNDLGVESFRDVRMTNVASPSRGDLYYLGFGVSNYSDPRLTLKYAHKDALDLGSAISRMNGAGYNKVFTRVLTDSQVTQSNLRQARDFLLQANADDTVVVFVAGHGVYDSGPHEQYYFVAYDTDMTRLSTTGATFDLIEDLVTGIAPRKKLLLLDTCQSGERDGDEEVVRVSAGRSRGLVARGIRPVASTSKTPALTRNPFFGSQDRFIFNDLSRRSGTIVFSASHGSELSYEDDRLQNGTFTYELIRALSSHVADADRNGTVSTDELRAYVTQAVGTRTEGLQNPTVDRDNLEALFGFPVPGRGRGTSITEGTPTSSAPERHRGEPTPFTTIVKPGEVTTIVVPSSKTSTPPKSKAPTATIPNRVPTDLPKGTVRRMPGQKLRKNSP